MRTAGFLLISIILGFPGQASEKSLPAQQQRFRVDLDTQRYPQNTPKQALGSVLRTIAEKRCDYLLAYLADPVFVDKRLAQRMAAMDQNLANDQRLAFAFERLVNATGDGFLEDPSKITELRRFYDDGDWEESGDNAVARLKGLEGRRVFMQRIGQDKWVLLDKTK